MMEPPYWRFDESIGFEKIGLFEGARSELGDRALSVLVFHSCDAIFYFYQCRLCRSFTNRPGIYFMISFRFLNSCSLREEGYRGFRIQGLSG